MSDMINGVSQMVGGIMSAHAANKARKWLSKLEGQDPIYVSSPYAKERYDLAKTLLNSRMAGAATMERGIQSAAGNAYGNIQRNTTDSSQALALMAGIQGQAGDQSTRLGQLEAQDYYTKYNNLSDAQQGMTQEHQNAFDDSVRRWSDKVNINQAKWGMRQAVAQGVVQVGQGLATATRDRGGEAVMGAAQGALSSAGSSVGGMVGGMLSDKRLKHNYHVTGKSESGINIYEFSYNGSDKRYQGVMAQEVPHASFITDNGYLAVDYSKIDVQFKAL